MAISSKMADLRARADEDLVAEQRIIKDELFKLRFQHATSQLEKTHRLPELKRTLARVNTILRERALLAIENESSDQAEG